MKRVERGSEEPLILGQEEERKEQEERRMKLKSEQRQRFKTFEVGFER